MSAPSTEESPWNAMGVFAPIFDDGHYLTFLNLNPPFDAAVEALKAIVERGAPDLEADVVAVLDPALAGWRPQLVGAAAMLLGATTPATLAALWRALEQPSWVSPQLAVAAFLRAPISRPEPGRGSRSCAGSTPPRSARVGVARFLTPTTTSSWRP